ncbi:CaiB/BaiF CoA transferase family protein [Denitromonas iodatirespirans]|uniref:CoA transferase n=1 Tax=Denitromonas iodatirespirans TaxID=2795389 RepID=A0A944HC98_DENI1|nr:CaiB/BaiF CoA-transferase family protein [Denitromonas iodatirespirans]MBT0961001.1 CoA transferase [Denitromonas iodatirespirans]
MTERNKPLAGMTVLDLTRLLPGPLATLHLADLGAEVIKIEDPGVGDYARRMGAMHGDTSYFFQLVNRNKKSLVLDLKDPADKAVLLGLVDTADILVEGFRPGVMAKLGLDYATLSARNPRLVYGSISGYGQTGPYAQRAGHDINYLGYAGVLDQIGSAGGPPALSNLQIADLLGGTLTPLVGLLAAVIDARANGRGRHVDVAMTDAALAHAIFPMAEVLAHGQTRPRGDDLLTGGVPCYGVYETLDGRHMAVGALEEKFWQLTCDTLGRPDLKPYHLSVGEQGRYARAQLEAIFRGRTLAEWTAVFDAVDCCVTPVLRLHESLQHPQIQARGMVVEVGGMRQFAPPFGLSEFSLGEATAAPAADADAAELRARASRSGG